MAFEAGYGPAPEDVPAPLRLAILMLAGHWFERREAAVETTLERLPLGVAALISPFRRIRL